MERSKKIVKIFGYIEAIAAVCGLIVAITGGDASSWIVVLTSGLTAYLLFAAAKDPQKIMPALVITVVDLVMSVINTVFILVNGGTTTDLVTVAVAVVLNCILLWACLNIRKQVK